MARCAVAVSHPFFWNLEIAYQATKTKFWIKNSLLPIFMLSPPICVQKLSSFKAVYNACWPPPPPKPWCFPSSPDGLGFANTLALWPGCTWGKGCWRGWLWSGKTSLKQGLKWIIPLCSLLPSASGFGVCFGRLNTFWQGIWSTRDWIFL